MNLNLEGYLLAAAAGTGAFVWSAITIVAVLHVIFGVIPALWRAACRTGYAAFTDTETRRALRERARREAEASR